MLTRRAGLLGLLAAPLVVTRPGILMPVRSEHGFWHPLLDAPIYIPQSVALARGDLLHLCIPFDGTRRSAAIFVDVRSTALVGGPGRDLRPFLARALRDGSAMVRPGALVLRV